MGAVADLTSTIINLSVGGNLRDEMVKGGDGEHR